MKKLDIADITKREGSTFVSIYMPLEDPQEVDQYLVKSKNLIRQAESLLAEKDASIGVSEFLKEAKNITEDRQFWNDRADGLVLIADGEETFIKKVNGRIPEKVFVGEKPYLLPLFDGYEKMDEYVALDIGKDCFALYELGAGKVESFTLDGVKMRFDELFDDRDVNDHDKNSTNGSTTSYHGHTTKSQNDEKEQEKYFRYVSDEVAKGLKEDDRKLILFGTTVSVAAFKKIAGDKLDIHLSIEKPFSSAEEGELRDLLKEKLFPIYLEELKISLEQLGNLVANGLGSKDRKEIQQEKEKGRIDTLYVSKKAHDFDSLEMNDLTSKVLETGGKVVVVNPDYHDFPDDVIAQYRF